MDVLLEGRKWRVKEWSIKKREGKASKRAREEYECRLSKEGVETQKRKDRIQKAQEKE